MAGYDSFEANRLKHMEMIQAVVGRLAGNSFLIKGWAITVAAAFFGFALNSDDPWLAAAGLVPTLAFWGIDAYFLKSERLFRALYDQVRKGGEDVEPFYMGATSPQFVARVKEGKTDCAKEVASWFKTAWRPNLAVFYCALLAANALVIMITYLASDSCDNQPARSTLLHAVAGLADAIGNRF